MALQKHSVISSTTTLLSTELNNLANGGRTNASSAYDNGASGSRQLFAAFELVVTFGTAPTAGKTCDLYLLATVDGTNYADGSASAAPGDGSYLCSIPVRAVNTPQRLMVVGVELPPTPFKILLVNNSGQAMAATGSVLKMVTSAYEIA